MRSFEITRFGSNVLVSWMSSARYLPLLDELATLILAGGALALSALLAAAFIAGVHVAPATPPDGVVGWTTIHQYSKRQEVLSYLVMLALTVAAGWGAAAADARLRRRDPSVRGALWRIAIALPLLVAVLTFVLQREPPPVYADALLGIAGAALVWVASTRLRPDDTTPVALAPGLPAGETTDSDGGFRIAAAVGAALLFATIGGWMLAVLLPSGAPGADLLRFVLPLGALGAIALEARRGTALQLAAGRAALATAPLLLLVAVLAVPFAGGVLVLVVIAALVAIVWRDPRTQAAAIDPRTAGALAAVALIAAVALSAWAHNPRILSGLFVGPLDGDALTSWLYEGTRGHIPFRDFWYPYGPLNYAAEYAGVIVAGLDRYGVVLTFIHWTISAACAMVVAATLFGRRVITVLAVPFMFLASLPEPRVWVGFAGFAVALWALRRSSRRAGAAAGMLLGLQALWSIEVFASAIVALGLTIGYVIWRDGRTRLRDPALIAIGSGLAGVLILGAAVGLATGSIAAFIASTTRFIGVVDACCAVPFPSVFGGLNALGGTPEYAADSRYLGFYLVPAIYAAAIVTIAFRARPSLRLEDRDVVLGAVTVFGAILFRAVLARTDFGHLAFVSVPAVAVALLLVQRAIEVRTVRPLTALIAVALLVMWPIPRSGAIARLVETDRYMSTLPQALQAVRREPPADWTEIDSPRGDRLWFPAADANDLRDAVSWLRAHTGPADRVYAIPYASRYEVLTDRLSPTALGPQMWSAIVTTHDQQRLVDDLRSARYVVYDEAEWPNTDGVAWVDRYPVVARSLEAEYHPVATFGAKVIYEHGAPAAPPHRVDVADDAAEALQNGWYAPEDPHHVRARWSAPQASLLLRPQRGDDALVLDYEAYDAPGAGRTLTVAVDDREISRVPLTAGRHHEVLALGEPAKTDRAARISLNTGTPMDAQDMRALGILVYDAGFARRAALPAANFREPLSAVPPTVAAKASFWDRGRNLVRVEVAPVAEPRTLEYVQILINASLTGVNACYVSIVPPSHSIFVAKDVGSDWLTPAEIGAKRTFANSQCRIDAAGARTSTGAGAFDVSVSPVLSPAFAQRRPHAWIRVKPAGTGPADWVQLEERGAP